MRPVNRKPVNIMKEETYMRIMGVVFTGMLAVCIADSAFAAAAYTKDCKGTHQSMQGGVCTNHNSVNPNRVVQERSADFYRSNRHKNKKPVKSD
jgi:hypothetical protein